MGCTHTKARVYVTDGTTPSAVDPAAKRAFEDTPGGSPGTSGAPPAGGGTPQKLAASASPPVAVVSPMGAGGDAGTASSSNATHASAGAGAGGRAGAGTPAGGGSPAATTKSLSTLALVMNHVSRAVSTVTEERLKASVGSRRVLVNLPPRVRRFSIAAEPEDAHVGRLTPGGGDSPSEAGERTAEAPPPPEYPKSDVDKSVILTALSKSFLFDSVPAEGLATLVDALKPEDVLDGTKVINQGDSGDHFYVVASGSLTVTVHDHQVGVLGPEDCFGELALMYDCPRNATVTTTSPCKLWALDRHTFKQVVAKSAARAVHDKVQFLSRVEILSPLSRRDLYRLAEVLTPVTFSRDDIILKQGEPGSVFYIIKSGQVSVFKRADAEGDDPAEDVEVIRLGIGSYFGEQALIHKQPRAATVKAIGTVECLAMHGEFFQPLLGPIVPSMNKVHSRREMAESRVRSSRRMMRSLDSMESGSRSPAALPPSRVPCNVELADLESVAVLGEGAFGVVRLVRHRTTRKLYALKVMQKARIVEMSQTRNVLMEKTIMMRANHPYILKLHRTYKDKDCLYMLLEFCQGGDMFTLLGRYGGRVQTHIARHYAAVVTTVLEYLHARQRDLKPENLVFTSAGHLKVVDFGFAKVVRDRTYTLCGTPEYLAPELVQGNGHHHGVDYWALGILVYEMLCGYSPFADPVNNNQLTIYRNIVAGKYTFPKELGDETAKDLIQRLLAPKASKRLGCLKHGTADLKTHRWFTGFDWEGLMAMRLAPPVVPELTGPTDLSFFDEIEDPGMSRVISYVDDGSNWDTEF